MWIGTVGWDQFADNVYSKNIDFTFTLQLEHCALHPCLSVIEPWHLGGHKAAVC